MPEPIHSATLPNGLTLLAEPVAGAKSLAMTLLLPAGTAQEPEDRQGVAQVTAEMVLRGAGGLSAREHTDALERLGVSRDTSVQTRHTRLSATMIGDKLDEAVPLLLDIAIRPNLDATSLEPSRDLALQELDGLADEPQQRVMIELRRRLYPDPLGRATQGQRPALEALTLDEVQRFHRETFTPAGSILGFAGAFNWEALRGRVETLTRDWGGSRCDASVWGDAPRGYEHLDADTQQVHIAMGYPSVPETDPDAMVQRAAVAVLSGGMSGRLFTEVREKRGLCYSVYASYSGGRSLGSVVAYAGTTTPRAQETLDVLAGELKRLAEGVEAAEFGRAKVGMKSRLVMQGESTPSRAAAIAGDHYLFGRGRTLAQLEAEVEAVTLDRVNRFVADHPPKSMTLVTVGPSSLESGGAMTP